MPATHPRSSDYPTKDPEDADLRYQPYAVRPASAAPNESRDVEPNTSGRSSKTPMSPRPGYVSGDVRGSGAVPTSGCTSTGQDALSPYGTALNDGASQGHVTTPDLRKSGPEDGPAKVAAGG
jgi:hypothetical protein